MVGRWRGGGGGGRREGGGGGRVVGLVIAGLRHLTALI